MALDSKVVLITGCSSGIGKALCEEFHQKGCRVVATARRLETLDELKSQGMEVEQLDVNNNEEINRVVETVIEREGKIDILINNAGYALIGPSIEIPEDDLLLQLKTNVIAPVTLAKKVAPSMRKNGAGIIVNIGSVSGVVSSPFAGAYCASKAAVHSLSDALRMELSPFGIQVVTVQPGAIRSQFGENAAEKASDVLRSDSWYQSIRKKILERARLSQTNATPTKIFARDLARLILKENPPSVIRLGNQSIFLPVMKFLLPRFILDRLMTKKFGINSLH